MEGKRERRKRRQRTGEVGTEAEPGGWRTKAQRMKSCGHGDDCGK